MAKKIYLSGKISGDPNFKEKFAQKAKELTDQGHLVFNPALHPDMFTWEQFMELDLKALGNCDAIYLLEDWKDSRGAKIEYDEALRLGKEVIFDVSQKKEKKMKVELQTVVSYKFRVELEDGSITPWQYFDKKPSEKDFEERKQYYSDLKKKGEDYTLNPDKIWNDYIDKVRSLLSEKEINDDERVLVASKNALGHVSNIKDKIEIIKKESLKRGALDRPSLVKLIKESAYPELSKNKKHSKFKDAGPSREM